MSLEERFCMLDSYLRDLKQDYSNIWLGSEQIDDVLNGPVGFVGGGLQFAIGEEGRMGLMMEAAVGQRAAEPLVEEQEQQSDIKALGGEAIGVALSIALEQSMALELAEVVTQLIQAL